MKFDKKLRLQIYERDEYCIFCGKTIQDIHHIIYRSHSGANIPENLIGLCRKHHTMVHSDEKHYVPVLMKYQEERYGKLTKEDLKC